MRYDTKKVAFFNIQLYLHFSKGHGTVLHYLIKLSMATNTNRVCFPQLLVQGCI